MLRTLYKITNPKTKPQMKTKNTLAIAAIAVMLTSFGCKKDSAGPQGPAGKDGNANVHSEEFTVYASEWWWNSTNKYTYQVKIPTYQYANTAVFVYLKINGTEWAPFPRTVFLNTSISQTQSFVNTYPTLMFKYQNSDFSVASPPTCTFKVVCIEPSSLAAHPDLDVNNYNEVKKAFSL